MANRTFDNVIIIDSAMGNFSAVGGTSASITNYNIIGISFWASSTLGDVVLTGANTGLDHIVHFSYVNAGSGIVNGHQNISFPGGLRVGALKCSTITAGSAFVYLG